jgi:hypothetical protein
MNSAALLAMLTGLKAGPWAIESALPNQTGATLI